MTKKAVTEELIPTEVFEEMQDPTENNQTISLDREDEDTQALYEEGQADLYAAIVTAVKDEPQPKEPKHIVIKEKAPDKKKPAKKTAKADPEGEVPAFSGKIISVTGKKEALTQEDRDEIFWIDIVTSRKVGKILTDVIEGVEVYDGERIYVALHHGPFKILIPAGALTAYMPKFSEGNGYKSETHMQKKMLDKRIGAEIDYVVQKIDEDSQLSVASRSLAMEQIRKYNYAKHNGRSIVYVGAMTEGRVQCVTQKGAIVEIKGVETWIPIPEITYKRTLDAAEVISVSREKILCKILDVQEDDGKYTVSASIKQTYPNPLIKTLAQLQPNATYGGIVKRMTDKGVFVRDIRDQFDLLCAYPRYDRQPVVGARVQVIIQTIDMKKLLVYGKIDKVIPPSLGV